MQKRVTSINHDSLASLKEITGVASELKEPVDAGLE